MSVRYYLNGSRHKIIITAGDDVNVTAASYSGVLSVAVAVSNTLQGNVSGLCGAYDGVLENEFYWRGCPPNRRGQYCQLLDCPGTPDCGGFGTCTLARPGGTPYCECEPYFGGNDCSQLSCPVSCGSHGSCCVAGYGGVNCDVPLVCPMSNATECAGHGQCTVVGNTPTCICDEGFTGPMCAACDEGLGGNDCNLNVSCPGSCSGRGLCVPDGPTANLSVSLNGTCSCFSGYEGADCSQLRCPGSPSACSGNGYCREREQGGVECICDEGFAGANC
ncbi:uncharacterized protein MONBRDRAFT_15048, partial [Monosiga brevicollis MX1]